MSEFSFNYALVYLFSGLAAFLVGCVNCDKMDDKHGAFISVTPCAIFMCGSIAALIVELYFLTLLLLAAAVMPLPCIIRKLYRRYLRETSSTESAR